MASRRDKIKSIIRKHYGKQSRFKTRGWEQCGREIYRLIDTEQEKYAHLHYSDKCDMDTKIRREIEREYESYFKVGIMFNWMHGNSNLKTLLDY
jgi:hypothetical protein